MNEALLLMRKNHIRHIVATVGGQAVGVLSAHDFARYHCQNISDPVSDFWSNSEVLLDEKTFEYAFDKLVLATASNLGDSSKTAKAIRDHASLSTITKYAIEEGLKDFAEILKLAADHE